ncbi:hypothetical protein Tco_0174640 [Tanacetum coccineum]
MAPEEAFTEILQVVDIPKQILKVKQEVETKFLRQLSLRHVSPSLIPMTGVEELLLLWMLTRGPALALVKAKVPWSVQRGTLSDKDHAFKIVKRSKDIAMEMDEASLVIDEAPQSKIYTKVKSTCYNIDSDSELKVKGLSVTGFDIPSQISAMNSPLGVTHVVFGSDSRRCAASKDVRLWLLPVFSAVYSAQNCDLLEVVLVVSMMGRSRVLKKDGLACSRHLKYSFSDYELMPLDQVAETGNQNRDDAGKYVVELARALASMPGVYRDDLLTRQIVDFFIALFRVDFTGRRELAHCHVYLLPN